LWLSDTAELVWMSTVSCVAGPTCLLSSTRSVLKSTRFDLIYDSNETMKKFEPHYRLVRVGMATKIEKTSKQQQSEQQYWKQNQTAVERFTIPRPRLVMRRSRA
ncbi:hypothetical protein KCU71_g16274, partial [Aureobasidium melanogenum]